MENVIFNIKATKSPSKIEELTRFEYCVTKEINVYIIWERKFYANGKVDNSPYFLMEADKRDEAIIRCYEIAKLHGEKI